MYFWEKLRDWTLFHISLVLTPSKRVGNFFRVYSETKLMIFSHFETEENLIIERNMVFSHVYNQVANGYVITDMKRESVLSHPGQPPEVTWSVTSITKSKFINSI